MEDLFNEFEKLNIKVKTTPDEYENIKDNYKYTYQIPLNIVSRCGHDMNISLFSIKSTKNYMCEKCENIDFESNYDTIKKRFEELKGVKLLTTIDEMITNHLNLSDRYDLEISNCADLCEGPHIRKSRYSDIKYLKDKIIYCEKCTRKMKKNGNLPYDEMFNRFKKANCTLITSKEEYEKKNMSLKDTYKFIASCNHESSGIPYSLELTRRKTPIKCNLCS